MTKSEIKQFYNIDKIVKASELAKLSQTYRDNDNTIIVMMKKKQNKPTNPPEWFTSYMSKFEQNIENNIPTWFKAWNEKVFGQVLERLTNIETRLDNLVAKNHLIE